MAKPSKVAPSTISGLIELFPGLPEESARVVSEVLELHARKMRDYGTDGDPYHNAAQASQWGVDPWIGASIRIGDKERRLQLYASGGTLSNEGAEDSILDNAVYNIIRLALWRRSNP